MILPSVCLLSYNRPEWARKTIESMKENTNYPYELIINDDGSTDYFIPNTFGDIEYSTLIENPQGWNEGVGRSINKCFKIATGDLLIKVDTDLNFAECWLEKTIELFEENPRLGLLGLCHYYLDPVDRNKTIINMYDDHEEHTHILGSCFAVRREVYEQFGIGSYSEAFAEDWELMKKIEADNYWYNGLPYEELASNYGMGLGNSTVAIDDGSGGIGTAKIHTGPYIINGGEKVV